MEARILQGEPVVIPQSSLIEGLMASCRKFSEDVCMIEADSRSSPKREVTYKEFLEKGISVSRTVREADQTPGKVVAIVSEMDIEAMAAVFGVWISGAASASLNPALPVEEMAQLLDIIKCEVAFCSPEYMDKVREAAKTLDNTLILFPLGRDQEEPPVKSPQEDTPHIPLCKGKDHVLSVMFTSGTTGVPKGVLIREEGIRFITFSPFFGERSGMMLTTPMYWISNIYYFASAIFKGSKLYLGNRATPRQLIEIVTTYKPTEWLSPPSCLMDLCKEAEPEEVDFSSLEFMSVGGSHLLEEKRREICRKLFGGKSVLRAAFGSTEAGLVTYDRIPPELESPRMASIGQVAEGVTVKIVDPETGKPQPPYKPGQIRVKSPCVLKNYINHTMTEEELDKEGFFNMGDLGYYDEEGYVYYGARIKDIMKYRGYQIAPAELEKILESHPDVYESCVVSKPCRERGDLPAAFVVRRNGSNISEEELYEFVSGKVIDQKKLRGGIYFLDSLPRNPVGKVLRKELRKQLV